MNKIKQLQLDNPEYVNYQIKEKTKGATYYGLVVAVVFIIIALCSCLGFIGPITKVVTSIIGYICTIPIFLHV